MKMNDFDWLLKCVNVHVYSSSFRNVQERSQIDVVNVVRSISICVRVTPFLHDIYLFLNDRSLLTNVIYFKFNKKIHISNNKRKISINKCITFTHNVHP